MSVNKDILKYAILPGIIPRILSVFKNGFFYTAYLIATIYGNVRLLPQDHPYINPQNIGRFSIRHVIAEAASRLVFKRNNIDQIVIFFLLLSGLGLFFMQFLLLGLAIFMDNPVLASNITDALGMFKNPSNYGALGPEQDIAFILLDRVFGTVGIYNSCAAVGGCTTLDGTTITATAAYPWAFHLALHKMLAFYSNGIFFVGALVILYFITTIVAETAKSGAPFGQRVNKAWAPIRFILFFALLIPINAGDRNEGFNAAQISTFWIARFGSNFATNAWSQFNSRSINSGGGGGLSNGYLTQQQSMVAQPNAPIPELNALLQFLYVARTCQIAYHLSHNDKKPAAGDNPNTIDAYIVRSPIPAGIVFNGTNTQGAANQISDDSMKFDTASFQGALEFSAYGNITIRFGQLAESDPANPSSVAPGFEKYQNMKGAVMPYCGDITLPIVAVKEPGAQQIQEDYFNLIQEIWTDSEIIKYAGCSVHREGSYGQSNGSGANCPFVHDRPFTQDRIAHYTAQLQDAVDQSIITQRNSGDSAMTTELIKRGWAGGGIWYNKIAAMNGALTSAILNLPKSSQLPMIMDVAFRSNRAQNKDLALSSQFSQNMADIAGVNVLLPLSEKEKKLFIPMKNSFEVWAKSAKEASSYVAPTGNVVTDFINGIFGTQGLYDMRNNADVHPMAQLTALGKGMLEAVTRNALFATGLMLGKNILGGITQFGGNTAAALEGFLFSMVSVTIAIGVLLYYVLPLMPFIYFLFAVSGWIKSIFEAIVAMPLWALAHLRIDGEGLPGPGATNGYFLLLEILLRPILILFGLLASINIFAALVNVLNQIFDLVTSNLTGHNVELESKIMSGSEPTGLLSKLGFNTTAVDEFLYTVMYAVICYMIGLSCFKLVDLIPNNILRYMGVSVSTFKENAGDPVGELSGKVYQGTQLLNSQITGLRGGDLALLLSKT